MIHDPKYQEFFLLSHQNIGLVQGEYIDMDREKKIRDGLFFVNIFILHLERCEPFFISAHYSTIWLSSTSIFSI